MDIALWVLVALFALKVLWNLSIPYVLGLQMLRERQTKTKGVSLLPWVESALLLGVLFLSITTKGEGWLHRPSAILGGGIGAILFSYVHLVAVGAAFGAVAARRQASSSS